MILDLSFHGDNNIQAEICQFKDPSLLAENLIKEVISGLILM